MVSYWMTSALVWLMSGINTVGGWQFMLPTQGTGSGLGRICPQAPPGAASATNQVMGYFAWGAIIGMVAGGIVLVALIVVGKIFNIGRLAAGAAVGLLVLIGVAIIYLMWPELIQSILGDGCVNAG